MEKESQSTNSAIGGELSSEDLPLFAVDPTEADFKRLSLLEGLRFLLEENKPRLMKAVIERVVSPKEFVLVPEVVRNMFYKDLKGNMKWFYESNPQFLVPKDHLLKLSEMEFETETETADITVVVKRSFDDYARVRIIEFRPKMVLCEDLDEPFLKFWAEKSNLYYVSDYLLTFPIISTLASLAFVKEISPKLSEMAKMDMLERILDLPYKEAELVMYCLRDLDHDSKFGLKITEVFVCVVAEGKPDVWLNDHLVNENYVKVADPENGRNLAEIAINALTSNVEYMEAKAIYWNQISEEERKQHIQPIPRELQDIFNTQPVSLFRK